MVGIVTTFIRIIFINGKNEKNQNMHAYRFLKQKRKDA